MKQRSSVLPAGDRGSTRDRIIAAAIRCFGQLTTDRTTLSDIARVAGVSRPTIYKYFKSKDEIVREAVTTRTRAVNDLVAERLDAGQTAVERLEEAVMACVEYHASDPQSRDMLNLSIRDLVVMLGTRQEVMVPSRERWIPILEEGRADGSFRPDLDIDLTVEWLSDFQILLSSRHVNLGASLEDIRTLVRFYLLDGVRAR